MAEEIEKLAKRLLLEVAAEWQSEPDAFITTTNGEVLFVCTVHDISGSTVIYYNPLPAVESLLRTARQTTATIADEELHANIVEINVRDSIRSIFSIAPVHFKDSLGELRVTAEAFKSYDMLARFGDMKGRDKVLDTLLDAIAEKKRQRFRAEVKPGKRSTATHVLTEFWVSTAVMLSDALGKKTAVEMEAARQIATLTKTTPTAAKAALRTWYQARGFSTWRDALEAVRAEIKARGLLDIQSNMKQIDEN
jgi:hypothetical protein